MGVNDHWEQPVGFKVAEVTEPSDVMRLLPEWKRMALTDDGSQEGEVVYINMNALHPDEHIDNLHSIYVGWQDWNLITLTNDPTISF